MFRLDPMQFSKKNKMLFHKRRWFIFLDLDTYSSTPEEYIPRLAHRCKPEERARYGEPHSYSDSHSCCLVIVDNEVCRDCHEPVPEVFSGFFNLARWSYE